MVFASGWRTGLVNGGLAHSDSRKISPPCKAWLLWKERAMVLKSGGKRGLKIGSGTFLFTLGSVLLTQPGLGDTHFLLFCYSRSFNNPNILPANP